MKQNEKEDTDGKSKIEDDFELISFLMSKHSPMIKVFFAVAKELKEAQKINERTNIFKFNMKSELKYRINNFLKYFNILEFYGFMKRVNYGVYNISPVLKVFLDENFNEIAKIYFELTEEMNYDDDENKKVAEYINRRKEKKK